MIGTGHLLAFAAVAFALIVVPGPSVLFVISRGVALGRRAALATVVGNAAGVYVQVVAVALGVGTIVARSQTAFAAVKLVGAGYLVWLGTQAIRHRRAVASALNAPVVEKSMRRILREGFVVGITNPKAVIFFTAIAPQFLDRSRGHAPLQLLTLGLIFIGIALVSDGAWGLAAGTARMWLGRSRRRLELLNLGGGLVMVGLGIRLALTGRRG
jgi:threonine/homoserine/homoserine lactone efflux protein